MKLFKKKKKTEAMQKPATNCPKQPTQNENAFFFSSTTTRTVDSNGNVTETRTESRSDNINPALEQAIRDMRDILRPGA